MLASPLRPTHGITTLVPTRDFPEMVAIEQTLPIGRQRMPAWIEQQVRAGAMGACSESSAGDMLGYVLYRQSRLRGGTLAIMRVAVRPEFQRHGIGRKLVERARYRAGTVAIDPAGRTCSRVIALIDEGDAESLRFFKGCGSTSRLIRDRHGRSDRVLFEMAPTVAKMLAGACFPL